MLQGHAYCSMEYAPRAARRPPLQCLLLRTSELARIRDICTDDVTNLCDMPIRKIARDG